jgi:predicted amidophosphoribosyltransferase
VPLHPQRRRERGFDQSALLADGVAHQLGCPTALDALQRGRATCAQATLDHAARVANVDGAFLCAAPLAAPAEARIVLVDDVVTTGATARAALAALGPDVRKAAVLAITRARSAAPAPHGPPHVEPPHPELSALVRPGGLC